DAVGLRRFLDETIEGTRVGTNVVVSTQPFGNPVTDTLAGAELQPATRVGKQLSAWPRVEHFGARRAYRICTALGIMAAIGGAWPRARRWWTWARPPATHAPWPAPRMAPAAHGATETAPRKPPLPPSEVTTKSLDVEAPRTSTSSSDTAVPPQPAAVPPRPA